MCCNSELQNLNRSMSFASFEYSYPPLCLTFQCAQLSDVGEESFLVTVRISDGASEHLGSIKGDHFCLLRQELLEDFHNFCLGRSAVLGDALIKM